MNLQEAEANLASVEGPRLRFHNARHDHVTLKEELERAPEKFKGKPKLIAAVREAHDEAETAHNQAKSAHQAFEHACKEKGLDIDREIDKAAQAVLDARGEKHTETGIKGPETDEERAARIAADAGEAV